MMTSSHQSHTTNFKAQRIKTTAKPPHQINNKEPSSATSQPVLKCPRCDSVNTKFCYYNNYSLAQPRHYCKNCRRYWTRGGALRNVPIGGSTRNKNKPCSLHVISSPPPLPQLFSNVTSSSSFHNLVIHPPSTARFSGYMFPLDVNVNHNLASSSIEPLSSLNQDLHQRLQQQRLITSMFLQDQSVPVNEKPVMFQNAELVAPSTVMTDWVFDRSVMGGGSNENNVDAEGSLGNWYHNANNNALL